MNWTGGAGDNSWHTAANWSGNAIPTASDDVTINASATVTASSQSAAINFNSLTIGGGTSNAKLALGAGIGNAGNLTVKNHGTFEQQNATSLSFGDITVEQGGVLTHKANSQTKEYFLNLNIQGDLTLQSGATIYMDGLGYTGGYGNVAGNGPGGGPTQAGAGHGGVGGEHGSSAGGVIYDEPTAPLDLGSGGGGGYSDGMFGYSRGGTGGGLLVAVVGGTAYLDGLITANSGNNAARYGGGGAGGGINISAAHITGSGQITANGGAPASGSAGGGGIIALKSTGTSNFTGLLSTYSGVGPGQPLGCAGPIAIKFAPAGKYSFKVADAQAGTAALPLSFSADIGSFYVAMATASVSDVNADEIELDTGAFLTGNPRLTVANNLTMRPGATLTHSANSATKTNWLELSIGGNLDLQAGATIYMDGLGYAGGDGNVAGNGPGGGPIRSGAGHGGAGGASANPGGATYDDPVAPSDLGSGGGGGGTAGMTSRGGTGGGLLVASVAGTAYLNGLISANSVNNALVYGGGGAGGGIDLSASHTTGTGQITANGGQAADVSGGGGGGGGRIAVGGLTCPVSFSAQTDGGSGITASGASGTIFDKRAASIPFSAQPSQNSLEWTWAAGDDVTSFRLINSTGGATTGYLPATTFSFQQTGLASNTTYTQSLEASTCLGANVANPRTYSTLALPVEAAAQPFEAVYPSSITVAWTPRPLSPKASTAEGYVVEASSTNFGVLLPGGVIYSTATSEASRGSLTVSGLSASTTYYIRVGSLNWDNAPNFTSLGAARTAAIGYAYPAFVSEASPAIAAQWVSNGNPYGTEYRAQISDDPAFETILASTNTYELNAVFSGLAKNIMYYVRIAVMDNGVPGDNISLGSAMTYAATPITPDLSGISSNTIALGWDSNGNGAAIQYKADVSTDSAFGVIYASTQAPGTNASFSALTPNTTYYLRVASLNDLGLAGPFLYAGPVILDAAAPSTRSPAIMSVSSAALSLQWDGGSNPPGTLYHAGISESGDFSVEFSTEVAAEQISFVDLAANTTYYARVSAKGWNGHISEYLLLGSTITKAAAPALAAQTFTDVSAESFTLHWSANNNRSGTVYKVRIAVDAAFSNIVRSAQTASLEYQAAGLASNTTYYAEVAALGADGVSSAYSYFGSVKTLAASPGTPTVAGSASDAVTVSWTSGGNAAGTQYEVQVATSAEFGEPVSSRTVGLTAVVGGLSANATYFARVGVVGENNLADNFSPIVSGVTLSPAPAPAAQPLTAIYANFITAAWQPVDGSSGYVLEASTSNFNGGVIYSSATWDNSLTSLSVTGLPMMTAYYLRVGSLNRNNAANYTALGTAWTPRFAMPVVVAPAYTDISESSVTVHWGANGNSAQTSYKLDVSQSPWFASYYTFTTTDTALMVYDLRPNASYYFRVQAEIPGTSSAYAALGEAVTLAALPQNIALSVYVSSASAVWSALADPSYSRGFALEASTDNFSGAPVYSASTANPAAASLEIPGLLTNTAYYARLASINSAGAPNYVQLGQFTTLRGGPPGYPEIFRVYASSVTLRWTSVHADGYIVQASSAAFDGTGAVYEAQTSDGEAQQLTLASLQPNTSYQMRVGALFDGVAYYQSAGSTVTLAYVPSDFQAVEVSSTGVRLSWGTNGNNAGTAYIVSYSAKDNFVTPEYIVYEYPLSTTGYMLAPLVPDTGYYIRIAAQNSAGALSGYSAIFERTEGTDPPPAPALVSALSKKDGAIGLDWEMAAGYGVTSYSIYRATYDFVSADGRVPLASGYKNVSYTDTPAAEGEYYYAVTAHDAYGKDSSISNTLSAVSDKTAPSAAIALSTVPSSGILGPAAYQAALAVSEVLGGTPRLTFTPNGQAPVYIPLSPVSPTLWIGTFTVTAAMASGSGSFAYEGQDLYGNVGHAISGGASWVLDTIVPTASLSFNQSVPAWLKAGGYPLSVLSSKALAQAPSLRYSIQGGAPSDIALSASSGSVKWEGTLNIASDSPQGNALFVYSATDTVGNASALLSGATYFVVDTVPCGAPQFLHAALLSGGRVQLSWSAPSGEKPAGYCAYRDSALLTCAIAANLSDFSGLYVDTATETQHTYQVSALDKALNESALSSAAQITPDATPPSAPTDFSASVVSGGIQLAWQGPSGETAASYRLYRSTAEITSLAGLPYRTVYPPLVDVPGADGSYHYAITAMDAAGNEGQAADEVSIAYDMAPPAIAVAGVSSGAYYNAPVTITFSATDLNLDASSVRATLNSQPFASGSMVSAQGEYALSVFASDVGGHASTATVSFVVDLASPTITVTGVADGSLYELLVAPVISAADANLSTFSAVLDGQPYASGSAIAADGAHALTATALDKAGNRTDKTVSFTLDLPPAKPQNAAALVSGGSARFSWTKPDADVVAYRVYKDGALYSASMLALTSFIDNSYAADAVHVYEIAAVDSGYREGARARVEIAPVEFNLLSYGSVVSGEEALNAGFFDS
ncbi:MAG TPA: fibronectin type III domain-containing protein, partial [Elusimicrobiales bacterium]|nr:fibronectin type III domain-containing protein [Elusimicrobiales bacterium]